MDYVTPTPLRALLFCNNARNGWSETWPLLTSNWDQALAHTYQLALARSYTLASGHWVEWACVHAVNPPWAEEPVLPEVIHAMPQWDVVNNDAACLLFYYRTQRGLWKTAWFRGIDNSELSDNVWLRAPYEVPPGIDELPAAPEACTKEALWRYCLQNFRHLTARHTQVGLVSGVQMWRVISWDFNVFRFVSSRRPGRPWVRGSWEPGDWTWTPWFSPCGMACTVQRTFAAVDCRFFVGGPVQRIHYYRAAPAAGTLTAPTIFWGRYRDKAIENVTRPGDLTGASHWTYSKGVPLGNAPADHFSATIPELQGNGTPPWSGASPTPAEYKPTCDLPTNLRIGGPGGLGMGGVGARTPLILGGGGLALGGHALGGRVLGAGGLWFGGEAVVGGGGGGGPLAGEFDGSSARINCGDSGPIIVAGNFTLAAWFEVTGTPAMAPIAGRWDESLGAAAAYYELAVATNEVKLRVSDGSTISELSAGAILPATRYHVAATWDGTVLKIYLDGSHVATQAWAGPISHGPWGTRLFVGANHSGPGSSIDWFPGTIEAVRLYDTDLDAAGVSQIYGSGNGLAAAGSYAANLVGWWKIDEGSGTTAHDSSGSGLDGTITGGFTWGTPGVLG